MHQVPADTVLRLLVEAVQGLQAVAKQQRTADFNKVVRSMKMGGVGASASSANTTQEVSPRKQLGLRAVVALQELHGAGRIYGS